MIMLNAFMKSDAVISRCGKYRYWLSRIWNKKLPVAVWIMLNPSKANATEDDPTIKKCMKFARSWGCGGIEVVNLFAYRATDPSELHKVDDPVGPKCDEWIFRAVKGKTLVVAAWGADPFAVVTAKQLLYNLEQRAVLVQCLGKTGANCPRHPLYVPSNRKLQPYKLRYM